MPTANIPAQAPAHDSGSRPEEDNHRNSAIAPNRGTQLMVRLSQLTRVLGRKENRPESTTNARPRKKSPWTPRHIKTRPAANKSKLVVSFTDELSGGSCINGKVSRGGQKRKT